MRKKELKLFLLSRKNVQKDQKRYLSIGPVC